MWNSDPYRCNHLWPSLQNTPSHMKYIYDCCTSNIHSHDDHNLCTENMLCISINKYNLNPWKVTEISPCHLLIIMFINHFSKSSKLHSTLFFSNGTTLKVSVIISMSLILTYTSIPCEISSNPSIDATNTTSFVFVTLDRITSWKNKD